MAKKSSDETLSNLTSLLKKNYGDIMVSVEGLNDLDSHVIHVTPSLDAGLGGGVAQGTITVIVSKSGHGKTTLALTIMAAAQRQYKCKCYYEDAENRLRASLLKTIPGLVWTEEQEKETGIPRLQVIRSTPEKILSAQDHANIIIQIFKDTKPGDPPPVVCLDSIAVLCTEAQMAVEVGESSQMMEVSKLLYTFLRQVNPILAVQGGALICLTHLQAKQTMYGAPYSVYGGNAPEYFASNYLYSLSSETVKDKNGNEIGKNTKFKVKKAALGPDGKEVIIYIRPGHGCDIDEDLVTTGIELGIIEQSGAWFKYKEEKYQGRESLLETLRTNTELRKNLWDEINTLVGS